MYRTGPASLLKHETPNLATTLTDIKQGHTTRKHDDGRANMNSGDQPRLEGTSSFLTLVSPKRTKKLKTESEAEAPRGRTRSRTRLKTPQGL